MDVTVIGHGSLMSGRGLSFSGALQVKDAYIVALHHCTRGFAKLSRYGDRFATDLEVQRFPLLGRRISVSLQPTGDVETLALTVPFEDFCCLVKREGYSPEAIRRLATVAEKRGRSLAVFLWELDAEGGFDCVAYRRRLFALTDYTSPHYLPHPVRIDEIHYGIVFLAPGFEGTGTDTVISVRQQTGVQRIFKTSEAWRRKPNDDQLAYFLSCVLAGVHGVSVRDLLQSADEDHTLNTRLRERLQQELPGEVEKFLAVTNASLPQYQQWFGVTADLLVRGGLQGFLH
ncbi:MAG: hypothetical protein AB7G75_14785 [Candidatus Binatia bacterium]